MKIFAKFEFYNFKTTAINRNITNSGVTRIQWNIFNRKKIYCPIKYSGIYSTEEKLYCPTEYSGIYI